MTPDQQSKLIKRTAIEHGFERCGIAVAGPITREEFYVAWLARGYAGGMAFLHRHQDSRRDLRAWLPWAKSVIVVAASYYQAEPPCGTGVSPVPLRRDAGFICSVTRPPPLVASAPSLSAAADGRRGTGVNALTRSTSPTGGRRYMPLRQDANATRGRVAMYAWGQDYHAVLRERLNGLVQRLRSLLDVPFQAQVCVDTSAVIERELAAAAGVGWIGKNTMLLHESLGSFFFLGEVITDLDLSPDTPVLDRCGTCRRCLDACPTAAFPQACVMDASRCISCLTIEHRGEIPPELAGRMGDWVFGCDVCQTVCPYNRRAIETSEARFRGEQEDARLLLDDILSWDEAAYRARVKGKAWNRARLAMWQRNARIAAKNSHDGRLPG